MDILKKIKASTLMETLVASVLILIVFMLSSLTLNHLFSNSIKNSTQEINVYLNELEYLYVTQQLQAPYNDTYKKWEITIQKNNDSIEFQAIHSITKKHINKFLIED